jgi:hypothetical protein
MTAQAGSRKGWVCEEVRLALSRSRRVSCFVEELSMANVDDGGVNIQREEVEMRTMAIKEGRDCTN